MPFPYAVVYDALVVGPRILERSVHNSLKDHHAQKEWFRISESEAIEAIRQTAKNIILETVYGIEVLGIATRSQPKSVSTKICFEQVCYNANCQKMSECEYLGGYYCNDHKPSVLINRIKRTK